MGAQDIVYKSDQRVYIFLIKNELNDVKIFFFLMAYIYCGGTLLNV